MSARPPVSLVLPNRNNEYVLDLALEALAEYTTYPDFELVVVDDGSTDRGPEILRRWRDSGRLPEMTLIEREHAGVVETLNAGLAVASGDLVVQLDGDAIVETPGWLERMVDFHRSDDRIGVVTPLVTFDSGDIHAAGLHVICPEGLHDRGTTPTEPTGARKIHTQVTRLRPETAGDLAEKPAEVDAALGVQMLYPRELALELGGYDPGFSPVWFDDLDLGLRIRQAGYKIFYTPEVHVIHRLDLRGDRTHGSGYHLRKRVRRAAGRLVPKAMIRAYVRAEQRGTDHPPHELRRLRHHYAYWGEKWGFDLLNPDMDRVIERYGDSEICWAYDARRRAAGDEILAAWSGGVSSE